MENKKPIFRFKNHVEGWKSLTLGEVSEIKTGPFGSTLHAKDYVESGTPIITTEHFKFGELPDTKLNTPQVSESDYQRLSSYKLIKGDIVFSRVGSVDINALVGDLQNGWLFSGRVLRVRPQVNVDSEYLHYLLETTSVKNDVLSRAVGQTMPSINTEILKNTNITMSIDVSEQKSIGEFLRSVDKIIKIHQQELETLKQTKQGFLQKMFPKKGEVVPEVRFSGFLEDWKEKHLKDLGIIRTGSTPPTGDSKNYSDEGLLWITPTDISNSVTKTSSKRLSKQGENIARVVEPGTILVTSIASIGKNTMVEEFASFNQQINSLTPFKENDSYFLLTQSYYWSLMMKSTAASATMQIVNKSDFSNIKVFVPSLVEQTKIGEFFKKLDKTIELHEKELEALKETKKAFLQKMFV